MERLIRRLYEKMGEKEEAEWYLVAGMEGDEVDVYTSMYRYSRYATPVNFTRFCLN